MITIRLLVLISGNSSDLKIPVISCKFTLSPVIERAIWASGTMFSKTIFVYSIIWFILYLALKIWYEKTDILDDELILPRFFVVKLVGKIIRYAFDRTPLGKESGFVSKKRLWNSAEIILLWVIYSERLSDLRSRLPYEEELTSSKPDIWFAELTPRFARNFRISHNYPKYSEKNLSLICNGFSSTWTDILWRLSWYHSNWLRSGNLHEDITSKMPLIIS